ncbi:helix-turn-helix domain-containing protein [Sporolactobacillus sp. THM19-2]|uniref:helix-turn-helix domain-containing protein n=1 Tax=Sporolactobacillus sp. THM19-2 TaxID=2511171 RepID=UPI001020D609|nr:helix-turn-helix transcriptional regulator [Sporolactobacillus sp. THM19-2]RYL86523.1 XRE family transcriptional regulator [Sporolactobacillus sp. THM19-2]
MGYQLGEIVKRVRQSKRYTQKYVSQNKMSRTTYAKIESCQMQPTVGKFMHILEKLDISYDEFRYIQNSYSLNGKEEIIHDFFRLSTNVDSKHLKILEKKCESYLSHSFDNVVSDIQSACKAQLLIALDNNYDKAYSFATKIWNRLSKLDNWYSTELKLINNIFFFFPLETGISIVKRALQEIERLSCVNGNNSLKPAYLLNLTLLMLNNNQNSEAYQYAKKAVEECTNEKRFDVLSLAYARKGIALTNLGKIDSGIAAINKSIQICDALDQEAMEQAIKEEIHQKINGGISF